MDDAVDQFMNITNSSHRVAEQYLRLSDGQLEQAMQLYFESGGIDLVGDDPVETSATAPPPASHASHPQRSSRGRDDRDQTVRIGSDDEEGAEDEPQITQWRRTGPQASGHHTSLHSAGHLPPSNTGMAVEDDEAIARRMQEELYAGQDMSDGVRAPMARTTETLVGPGADWGNEGDDDMTAALEAQMAARRQRMQGRAGIFNQRAIQANVWDEATADPNNRRRVLSQATGGASESSSKASMLAEMYRPPIEIMSHLPWDDARQEGKSSEKWMLVNVQDPAVFDCQILNRDIWKDTQIRETIKENFIFMQYNKDDPRGNQYIQFYFRERDTQDAYPHIAIVDPRTGEQVKVWSGPPVPKPMDFLMQLHEFLDRYSLKPNAKNPIAARKTEKPKQSIDVNEWTEEQMLEMALQNSLATQGSSGAVESAEPGKGKGREGHAAGYEEVAGSSSKARQPDADSGASPFSSISSSNPHVEPAADPTATTRIQFRHSGGRIIRRFLLTDPVRRLYEWLKAEPLDGKAGIEFALVSAGRNLLEQRDESIDQAGLRNQTVMIEFLED